MVDPHGDGAAEAFRAGERRPTPDLARTIDAMWSQALQLAKQILDGELQSADDRRASAGAGAVGLTRLAPGSRLEGAGPNGP